MASPRSSLRSPLGAVRGLGSAKDGTHHWWLQRVSAIALVPLTIWFVASLVVLAGSPYEVFVGWVAQPLVAVLLGLFVGVGFWHLKLGAQVVIEDYIHAESTKLIVSMLVNFATVVLGAAAVFSILKIAI
ncbi:succinate dehydrogenase, hydrophobic membrane anchor protein [Zavarzinia compransoris]|uniref:Succinate dehydrogenase hydrophobic membrane anchor subunit n=1 Tax=Zavarzinia compransoris TaxID=1264899 RepID=A0A317DW41_9PROT|nr:succinate dehydrogenase, hydrophobic membrane anchor protein [Zavarzinia compransoris]PWR18937.1 succinate dehydrogenase, hydrophobic membrane anchor protein [Zavarzinia compransoris]TDP48937.1 succinate dehydrogenase subunit D [Zavarzinia compransoris]